MLTTLLVVANFIETFLCTFTHKLLLSNVTNFFDFGKRNAIYFLILHLSVCINIFED